MVLYKYRKPVPNIIPCSERLLSHASAVKEFSEKGKCTHTLSNRQLKTELQTSRYAWQLQRQMSILKFSSSTTCSFCWWYSFWVLYGVTCAHIYKSFVIQKLVNEQTIPDAQQSIHNQEFHLWYVLQLLGTLTLQLWHITKILHDSRGIATVVFCLLNPCCPRGASGVQVYRLLTGSTVRGCGNNTACW